MTSQAEEAEIQDYVNEIIRKPAEEVRVTRYLLDRPKPINEMKKREKVLFFGDRSLVLRQVMVVAVSCKWFHEE
jgi:hypothetical protein